MTAAIVHRGPDAEGAWAEDGFGFAMRRLSVIDPSGGSQPMWDEASGLGLVYNGEIYNYKDLRARLAAKGRAFTTGSDTEVALAGLAAEGPDAVAGWNGMFAAASWDPRRKRLLLIRDRMGIKPLYYYQGEDGTLLFASEIKAILASGLVPLRLNPQAVWDYLTFRYVPPPQTIWTGIRKLPPGTILDAAPGRRPLETRYWDTDVLADLEAEIDEEAAYREFERLFLDSVRSQLTASDVPVGALLSGGLDSSAVVAAAAELGHGNLHSFSVGFAEGDVSELYYARQAARHAGTRHHEVVLGRERYLESLPEVIRAMDEPVADFSAVALLAVCRLAGETVKVVLSGEGSDDVLGGYDLDARQRAWSAGAYLRRRAPAKVLESGARLAGFLSPDRHGPWLRRVAEVPPERWSRQESSPYLCRWEEEEKRALWPTTGKEDSGRILDELYARAKSKDPLQQSIAVQQRSWFVEDLLMQSDKLGMAASLEVRVPFLDHRIVEWANRQPNSMKVRRVGLFRYETKHVLRRFCRKRLPRAIVDRPKGAFPTPLEFWFRNGLRPWVSDLLESPESRVAKAFRAEAVRALIEGAARGDFAAFQRMERLIILEIWLRTWNAHL